MKERALATVQRISKIESIPDANKIELASILGWKCIVGKNEFEANDLVVYFEVDSVLPASNASFEFLRKRCYFDNGVVCGYRIKPIKMKGVISQGLILSTAVLPSKYQPYKEGDDVTRILGVVKYISPDDVEQTTEFIHYPFWLSKVFHSKFKRIIKRFCDFDKFNEWPPQFPHTDETRIQSNPDILNEMKDKNGYGFIIVTEKIDGQSASFGVVNDVYYVCSRTTIKHTFPLKFTSYIKYKLIEKFLPYFYKDHNSNWTTFSKEVRLMERLIEARKRFFSFYKYPDGRHCIENFVIQGELAGPGIQKNRLHLPERRLFVFSFIDLKSGFYYSQAATQAFCEIIKELGKNDREKMSVQMVPIICEMIVGKDTTIEDFEKMAQRRSLINSNELAEGIVVRSDIHLDTKKSFKVINPEYLLSE